MKRWPIVTSFVLFIVLCASAVYWAMQLFKPPLRPVVVPPRVIQTDVKIDGATGLFGGKQGRAVVASNYQLRGVIFSGNAEDSIAILSADGKPANAIRVGRDVLPGVTVKEVHRQYVLLSENGISKRIELPESAKDQGNTTSTALVPDPRTILSQQKTPVVSLPAVPARATQPSLTQKVPATIPAPPSVVVNSAQPGQSPRPANTDSVSGGGGVNSPVGVPPASFPLESNPVIPSTGAGGAS